MHVLRALSNGISKLNIDEKVLEIVGLYVVP